MYLYFTLFRIYRIVHHSRCCWWFIRQAPESYDLWNASSIVEACLVAKFDRLPPGIADTLKSNPTFVEEDGPMRKVVLAASPLTKEELLTSSPGAVELAMKASVQ